MQKRTVTLRVGSDIVAEQLVPLLAACGISTRPLRDKSLLMLGLQSEMFDALPLEEVYSAAVEIVSRLGAFMQIYQSGIDTSLGVTGIIEERKSYSAPFRLNVISVDGFERLKTPSANGDVLVIQLMQLAQSDERVAQLLKLLPGRPPTWYDLYDILEFFGLQNGIVKRGWADTTEASRHVRTAGRHRHPGLPQRLPPDPPTIEETRGFVMNLVRRWLEEMVSRP